MSQAAPMGRMVLVRLAALVIALVSLSAGVRASQADEPPVESAAGIKSGDAAFAYSFLGTALPAVASAVIISSDVESDAAAGLPILAGYLVGPSLGHFYAGRPKRALTGIGIRSAAAAGFAVGLSIEEGKSNDAPSANTLMVVTFIVGLSSMLIDTFEAPRSARIHNEGINKLGIRVAPSAIGADRAAGLRVDLAF